MQLYDASGRVVMRAMLGMYEQVFIDKTARQELTWIAGDYKTDLPGQRLDHGDHAGGKRRGPPQRPTAE